ncbi:MAG: polyphosphate kinase 2 [Phycisphaeraceae bacterium]|nr:polyphosphate kinase 2 [Phycisphaeraceae bacterium]
MSCRQSQMLLSKRGIAAESWGRHRAKSKPMGDKQKKADEKHFEDLDYPYDKRMRRKVYEDKVEQQQIELLKLQRWVKATGQRVLVIFEGRDAAGKGGTIKRFIEHLNPRGARVVALPKPNETERTQWYYQRYIAHLPSAGEIAFFDRSWYNRAGVEPVMGFCTPEQHAQFLRDTPEFERLLVNDGIYLFKLWFAVSRAEQAIRFESRRSDVFKQWKLSPVDEAAVSKWDEYTIARDHMFFHTHTSDAPWTVVRSDDKRRARLGAIGHVLTTLNYDEKDTKQIGEVDPLIVGNAYALHPGSTHPIISIP